VAAGDVRATSFGQIADDYDRVRPGPPDQALDWLIPQHCQVAIDLAAGTGLFTRALRQRVPDVIAVEPDDRMRAVLAARSPGVRAIAGRGEAIPVPEASADALFISSAWHWLDPVLAVPEIARVLRDGGRLGVIWTTRNRTADWVAELDKLRAPVAAGDTRTPRGRHEVALPENAPFENIASETFSFTRTMTAQDAVSWLATYSGMITAPPGQRADVLARSRDVLLRRADEDGMVEIPMRSFCWRADRVRRP
jgi:ubiquinone/menaquinone biosynthesis C-methylase UbiE